RAQRRSQTGAALLSRRPEGGGRSGRARGRAGGSEDLTRAGTCDWRAGGSGQKREKAGPRERAGLPRIRISYFLIRDSRAYSTGSAVSSAAMRSERRNRRSLAVTSKVRRGCTTRAGAVTLVSAAVCERLTKPTTASSVTFISKPAARAFSRQASALGFSAAAAAVGFGRPWWNRRHRSSDAR